MRLPYYSTTADGGLNKHHRTEMAALRAATKSGGEAWRSGPAPHRLMPRATCGRCGTKVHPQAGCRCP